jgi:hypothetical protein
MGVMWRGATAHAGGFRALAGGFRAREGNFFALAVPSPPAVLVSGFSDGFIV